MHLWNKFEYEQYTQALYCKLVKDRNSTKLYLFSCTIGTIKNLYDNNTKNAYY